MKKGDKIPLDPKVGNVTVVEKSSIGYFISDDNFTIFISTKEAIVLAKLISEED
jgi:hypothetical protein